MEKTNTANPEAAASCRFKSNAITEEPASLQTYDLSTGPKLSGSMYIYIAHTGLCSRHRDNAEGPASLAITYATRELQTNPSIHVHSNNNQNIQEQKNKQATHTK